MESKVATIERYEMKYRIPRQLVAPVRDVIKNVCGRDPAAGENGRYRIASLYLDSPGRRLYHETINRAPHRFKLRVRRYDAGPAFLEVKHRVKDVVRKTRVRIPRSAWPAAFHDLRAADALELPAGRRREFEDFAGRCLRLHAEPATVVRYEREAWVSTIEDYGRVTFDFRLVGAAPVDWSLPMNDEDAAWRPCDTPKRFGLAESGVVLELKCTLAVPYWMTDLVSRFALRRSGFSKYASALESTAANRSLSTEVRWPSRRARRAP